MFAAYLVCLIVGGVFVGMSVLSGVESDADADTELDGELHLDADADLDLDLDHGFDHDFGHDLDHDVGHDLGHGLDVDHDLDGPSLADAGLAGEGDAARGRSRGWKIPWLPFMSFRFWTFGSAFFGLTGTLLTALALTGEPSTLLAALGVGVGVGTLASTLIHRLRRSVDGDSLRRADYIGKVGELLVPLRAGATSKLVVKVRHREVELLATTDDPRSLPAGTRVIVLEVADDGLARVVVERSVYGASSTTPSEPLTRQTLDAEEDA